VSEAVRSASFRYVRSSSSSATCLVSFCEWAILRTATAHLHDNPMPGSDAVCGGFAIIDPKLIDPARPRRQIGQSFGKDGFRFSR
jgi:hypothetical protein